MTPATPRAAHGRRARWTRRAALVLLLVAGAACGGEALRRPVTQAERLEFERDHERCVLQSEDPFGVRQPGDYRACMRARGWSGPPD